MKDDDRLTESDVATALVAAFCTVIFFIIASSL